MKFKINGQWSNDYEHDGMLFFAQKTEEMLFYYTRVEGEHIKGEEVKKMVLSDFKTEQLSLFDMVEED